MVLEKNWVVAEPVQEEIIARFPKIGKLLLQLLWNRGIKQAEQIEEYLKPDWFKNVLDPYLFKHMTKAVKRIYEAIGNKEVIAVYGDYDADGVCAATILLDTLNKLGAQTEYYIPHREKEGYGLKKEAINYLQTKKVSLIITCDCGIANLTEVAFANSQGINVIITDHHQAQDALPEAYAILHAGLAEEKYPFKKLSGGGTAFKLVQGLLRYDGCPMPAKAGEAWEKWLLDLVAISTIADMVPVQGENRVLVNYGLTVLKKTQRLGLQKLMQVANINVDKISAQTVSFQIAPRLNAAGRLDHANTALALLMANNEQEATELAKSISLTNSRRQKITEEMFEAAKKQIGELAVDKYLVQAYQADWQLGMVGLVAGKLVQYYNRPALVLCDNNGQIMGSGRSGIGDFDLAATFTDLKEYLTNYGGHKEAAGLSLPKANLEIFLQAMDKAAALKLNKQNLSAELKIDAELKLAEINWDLLQTVSKVEPVGQTNPGVLLVSRGLRLEEINPVGSDGQHIRLIISQAGTSQKFIFFNGATKVINLTKGAIIDVVYQVGINEWNGNQELQLKIIDIKSHDQS
ncbi:single-stranded-DNA-specific exonuclease RecJ [Patescibacteria group bacterium]|nr:single-stranded-DNA-specific exonuclease RecJ [Patescibacteria group bacterium]